MLKKWIIKEIIKFFKSLDDKNYCTDEKTKKNAIAYIA